MKNVKIMIAMMGAACVIALAGCEKKDEPGARIGEVEEGAIVTDTKDMTETIKEGATEASNEAVTAAEDAKKKAEEEAKKAEGGH